MNYYEDMIKNPSRTTFNYDFKGMQELLDLIALRKHGIYYNPELTTLDSAQDYLDRIKKNRGHRFYGGRVVAEDLDFDPRTDDNILILNNKDLPAAIDGYEYNDGKKDRKNKRIRINYPFKYQRDALKGTPELRAFNVFYNLPLSVQQQYDSPAAWAEAVKTKIGNKNYFDRSMYVVLGSEIREYLDEYKIKDTYGLTGTEVNTIATKAASALSNLVNTKALSTANKNDTLYLTACDIVLNLYFGTSIDIRGREMQK
jgi:hypothetical protein